MLLIPLTYSSQKSFECNITTTMSISQMGSAGRERSDGLSCPPASIRVAIRTQAACLHGPYSTTYLMNGFVGKNIRPLLYNRFPLRWFKTQRKEVDSLIQLKKKKKKLVFKWENLSLRLRPLSLSEFAFSSKL